MEILFYRYGSICEPDIIDAMRICGLTVTEESTEIRQKSISFESRIRILGGLILSRRPAFVFSINYFPHISELCEKTGTLYVSLTVDCPVLELFHISIRNRCNRIFLFDHAQYQRFHPENPECIFYLPLAANTSRWDDVLSSLTDLDRQKYVCDLSFVGSLYTEKSPLRSLSLDDATCGYIDGLIDARLCVPGYDFLEEILPPHLVTRLKETDSDFYHIDHSFENTDNYVASNYYLGMEASSLDRINTLSALGNNFSLHLYTRSNTDAFSCIPKVICRGGVTTHTEMPKVFYYSKINLNITMKSIQTGLSQRIWDILGCKGFLLTNYQSEIPEYFEIGKDLACYEDLIDLKEKVSYYLTHEDERKEIARNGYKKTAAHHTYIHRVYQILKTIFPTI